MTNPMVLIRKKTLPGFLALVFASTALIPAAQGQTRYRQVYDTQTHQYYYVPENTLQSNTKSTISNAWQNPVVKQAVIGGAVGAAAGIFSDRSSVGRGALVGAMTGAGTGLIDRSNVLSNHPVARTALKGAAIGLGTSAVMRTSGVKGALVGAGIGAGAQYVKDYMNRDNRWDSGYRF